MSLSVVLNWQVGASYTSHSQKVQSILLILSIILIPINILVLVILELQFLKLLNHILKSAEHIFMHFHVTVLIENTYLTSYFNSKIKQNK